MSDLLPWLAFNAFILALLALDLVVFHRKAHEVSRREALGWSVFWIGLALAFNGGVYWLMGTEAGLQWTTGYLIEKSLSVDNVFLFLIIFSTFAVPAAFQHRVLFWGVVGALVMRGILILAGAALIEAFHWVIYLFGALLLVTGLRFLRTTSELDPSEHFLVQLARRRLRITESFEGQRFFVRRGGLLYATPLLLVLLVVESTDLIFAVDSIPAIFAITTDPFIVYTSNVFAILGLRALFFLLAGYLHDMPYLKPALAAILVFVGGKMLLSDVYHVPPLASLGVVVAVLAVAVVASLLKRPGGPPDEPAAVADGDLAR